MTDMTDNCWIKKIVLEFMLKTFEIEDFLRYSSVGV